MRKNITEKIKRDIKNKFPESDVNVRIDQTGAVTLTGRCESWDTFVRIGKLAASNKGVRNVVNDIEADGVDVIKKDYEPFRQKGHEIGEIADADVLIIGAGISGCAIARELSKYNLSILVAEQSEDVATGATKANNGNIHPGHAVKHGTLKAKLNVEGNRMYDKWSEELDFEFQRCGAMGVAQSKTDALILRIGLSMAKQNGVDGVTLVSGERALELEPGLADAGIKPQKALWLPSMGLIEPFKVTVALAENAAQNGARFLFNCTVADILTADGKVIGAVTDRGIINARYVINCAGSYADDISAMAGDRFFSVHPRKGVIAILDNSQKPIYGSLVEVVSKASVSHVGKDTKGGGMCRTPEWNMLLGPSAKEVPDKEDTSTTREELAYSMSRIQEAGAGYKDIIRFFAGSRAPDFREDFIIEMSPVTSGFVNVAGIQSPGLTAAPAIAKMVENILLSHAEREGRPIAVNPEFNPIRKEKKPFRQLSREEQDVRIKENPAYGRVICRCEQITEGEILDAIDSPVVPGSVDAIKRRTRAGMGRCQGGFCQPRVLEILAHELGKEWTEINLKGEGTNILLSDNRGGVL